MRSSCCSGGVEYDGFTAAVGELLELIRAGRVTEGRKAQIERAGPLAERLETAGDVPRPGDQRGLRDFCRIDAAGAAMTDARDRPRRGGRAIVPASIADAGFDARGASS